MEPIHAAEESRTSRDDQSARSRGQSSDGVPVITAPPPPACTATPGAAAATGAERRTPTTLIAIHSVGVATTNAQQTNSVQSATPIFTGAAAESRNTAGPRAAGSPKMKQPSQAKASMARLATGTPSRKSLREKSAQPANRSMSSVKASFHAPGVTTTAAALAPSILAL